MFWIKIDDPEYVARYNGYEWESDQSDDALRAVLTCDDRGCGFRLDTFYLDSNLDYDEIIEIGNKMSRLNKELADSGK